MTPRTDVAPGRDPSLDLGERWRLLAERRLEYLTELFESGRWRRFYSERAFLENIREAKAAVTHWRNLSTPQSVPDQKPTGAVGAIARTEPIIVEAPKAVGLAAASETVAPDEMQPAPAPQVPKETESRMSPARYPLLRNML
jgi:uncharacterized repeat protein (TIGR03809 family)